MRVALRPGHDVVASRRLGSARARSARPDGPRAALRRAAPSGLGCAAGKSAARLAFGSAYEIALGLWLCRAGDPTGGTPAPLFGQHGDGAPWLHGANAESQHGGIAKMMRPAKCGFCETKPKPGGFVVGADMDTMGALISVLGAGAAGHARHGERHIMTGRDGKTRMARRGPE
jgi:hypothetical protein